MKLYNNIIKFNRSNLLIQLSEFLSKFTFYLNQI